MRTIKGFPGFISSVKDKRAVALLESFQGIQEVNSRRLRKKVFLIKPFPYDDKLHKTMWDQTRRRFEIRTTIIVWLSGFKTLTST